MASPMPTPLQQQEERVPSRKQSIEISHQEETKAILTPQLNIIERSYTEVTRIEHDMSREEDEQSTSINHSYSHIPEIQASLDDGEGTGKMPKKKKKAKKAKKKLTGEEEQSEHSLIPDRDELGD